MFKKELAPGIILYRPDLNMIDDLEDGMKNRDVFESDPYVRNWHSWGVHDGFIKLDLDLQKIEEEIEKYSELKNISSYVDFFKTYKLISSLYLKDVEHLNILKPYINYDIKHKDWLFGGSMFQLQAHKSKKYSDEQRGMAFGFHFDIADSNTDPGIKHIFTGNLYLNDEYESGEIVFLFPSDLNNVNDFDNFKSLTYKPKRGDFIFYPADWPVIHGVRFTLNSDRYVVVSTTKWQYDGSMGDSLNDYILNQPSELGHITQNIKEENKQYIDGKSI
jgi:hypothetical protein